MVERDALEEVRGVAAVVLARAHRSFARLAKQRDSLEREIATSARMTNGAQLSLRTGG